MSLGALGAGPTLEEPELDEQLGLPSRAGAGESSVWKDRSREKFFDDLTDFPLEPALVAQARREGMDCLVCDLVQLTFKPLLHYSLNV